MDMSMDQIVNVLDVKQPIYVFGEASVHAVGFLAHPFDEYWTEGSRVFGFLDGKLVELTDGIPKQDQATALRYRAVGWRERRSRKKKGLRYAAMIGIL